MHIRSIGICLALIPALACFSDSSIDEFALAAGNDCLECGLNSPTMFGVPFHDIHPNPTIRNDQGIRLVAVSRYGGSDTPEVCPEDSNDYWGITNLEVDGGLWGTDWAGPHLLTKCSRFYFERKVGDAPAEQATMQIVAVDWIESWFDGSGLIPSYRLSYAGDSTGAEDFCASDGNTIGDLQSNDDLTAGDFVVFAGERLDFDAKTISQPSKGNKWINFACKGSASSKMHLARHTLSSSTVSYQSTWAERQALLKMYVADYCGDGNSHTVAGQPLAYLDAKGWFDEILGISDKGNQFSDVVSSYEAIWDENGAVCLNTPRLGGSIECEGFTIPTCSSNYLDNWDDHGLLISGTPEVDLVIDGGLALRN